MKTKIRLFQARLMCAVALGMGTSLSLAATFSDANWISMGGGLGAGGYVYAAVVDGAGNIYIGGGIASAGQVIANGVAKWNGSSWSALGSGLNGQVYALAVSGSELYAGGKFTTAGSSAATNIAKWDGNTWSALGSGISAPSDAPFYGGIVWSLAVSGSDLYAGGQFTTAGGSAASNIAKWDGSSWSAVGSGLNNTVSALAVSGSNLYAGGRFGIAKWEGNSWSALSSGVNDTVFALAVSGNDLYAGGSFTTAGGIAANHIAKWDGSSWSALGSGMDYAVEALAVSGGDLYAGGGSVYGGSGASLAKWNGSSWSGVGAGIAGYYGSSFIYALAASGSDLYAGGSFTTAGDSPANNIARWNGSSWSALGSGGMNGQVRALAASSRVVYAGGQFTVAGNSFANYVAKWDGTGWSGLGSGMYEDFYPTRGVYALAMSGSDVYAGGTFTRAGGIAATNIAKWDGTNWSALGSSSFLGGGGYGVQALAVSGTNLYAGSDAVFKWDGSSWSELGFGWNGPVYALAVSGGDLYAGGSFTNAGGIAANHIAKWDGGTWSALGSGVNYYGVVYALAVSGGDLYVGGIFTTAGGIAATNIAKWDGTNWSGLGSGIGGVGMEGMFPVSALAVSGGNLYAGGNFTNAGGVPANYIAKWDGNSWSALGSGLSPHTVWALAVSGSDLYAGGLFTTAGGKFSAYLARAIVNPPVLAIAGDGDGGYFIRFSGVPGSAYRLERAPGVSGPWATSSPQTASATGLLEFWDLFPPPGQGFYRSVGP